jgi:hypothetical protein
LRKLQVQAIGRYLFLVQNLERIDAGGASIAAWLHQFIVHRFTFVLFRLYATAVVSRIGTVLMVSVLVDAVT